MVASMLKPYVTGHTLHIILDYTFKKGTYRMQRLFSRSAAYMYVYRQLYVCESERERLLNRELHNCCSRFRK
jgi:hypothetical protein